MTLAPAHSSTYKRDMHTESTNNATRLPTVKSRVTNGTKLLSGVDGRSSGARRFRDLADAFAADLDTGTGLTEAEMTVVRQAAGVALRAEQVQAAIVNGADVDLNELTRLSNVVSRLMGALKAKRQKPTGPSLAEYLASKGAAEADT